MEKEGSNIITEEVRKGSRRPHGKDRLTLKSLAAQSGTSWKETDIIPTTPVIEQHRNQSIAEIEEPPADDSQEGTLTLSMFGPGTNEELTPLVRNFFGPNSLILEQAAHLTSVDSDDNPALQKPSPRTQMFLEREERKKIQYLKTHSSISSEEYDEYRRKQLMDDTERAKRKANKSFYTQVVDSFTISGESPKKAVDRHLINGTDTLSYLHRTIFPAIADPSRNEVQLPSVNAAEDLMTIASPSTDQVLAEQLKQRYLLGHISAEIESTNPDNAAGRKLSKIQQVLNKDFFKGKTGQTEYQTVLGVFSNDTNELISFAESEEETLRESTHIKECVLPMRRMKDTNIAMYISANEKKPSSGITKALRKAISRDEKGQGDSIRPSTDVTDTYRMKFVVQGGEENVDIVMNKVFDILVDSENQSTLTEHDEYGNPIYADEILEVIKDVHDDSAINGDKDQSKGVSFKRIQVEFEDLTHPVEIMFMTMSEFFTSEYSVGIPHEGKFTGAAHELYSISRATQVGEIIFDNSVYQNDIYENLPEQASLALNAKADELRRRKKITLT